MRRHITVIGFLLVLMLVVSLLVGCSKIRKPSIASGPLGKVVAPGNDMSQIEKARAGLTSFEMTVNSKGQDMTQAVKFDGGKTQKMKLDMGGGRWMLVLNDEKKSYMYDPSTNTAMEMTISDKQPNHGKSLPDMADLKAQAPKVSSTKLDGVDCWLVELNGGKMQSWIDKEYGLPRQEKIGDQIIKHTYTNINSVPDSVFELPAGVKITKMPDMKNMMPPGAKMPDMPKGMPMPPPPPGQ